MPFLTSREHILKICTQQMGLYIDPLLKMNPNMKI